MFPREFGRYIEIFGGSGAVLLGKEPGKFEVYNDIEGELVNFFRVVKNRPAELLLELDLLPLNSREEFASWLHFHDGGNEPNIHLPDQLEIIDRTTPSSLTEEAEKLKTSLRKRSDYRDVRQAAAYLMRVRNSYSSSGRSFACQPFSVRTLFTQIWEMSRRLENVIIEQQSFEVLIPHYDRDDSFFYGDPPYYDSEYVYDAEFGWDHHSVLCHESIFGIVQNCQSAALLRQIHPFLATHFKLCRFMCRFIGCGAPQIAMSACNSMLKTVII